MHPIPILAALMLAAASPTWAGEGQDHGHDHGDAPAATSGPALPRFAAESELFELVGVLDGTHLTLWLDHAADNSPVEDARLELELGGIKIPVEAHAEGEFEATLAKPLAPGEFPVAATVYAGEETDLLAGDLDIHAEGDAHEAAEAAHRHGWQEYALWAAIAGTALAGLGWLIRHLRSQRVGGVA
jgi:hypothetical protein